MCSLCVPPIPPICDEKDVWACRLSVWFLNSGTWAGVWEDLA